MLAELVEATFPDKSMRILDVAGGKGQTQAALRRAGYENVVSVDTRTKYASGRPNYRYGAFDWREPLDEVDLLVAMHPDEATDHVLLAAKHNRVPCVVVPCCIKPSATTYHLNDRAGWMAHLRRLLPEAEQQSLPIHGCNAALVYDPRGAPRPTNAAAARLFLRGFDASQLDDAAAVAVAAMIRERLTPRPECSNS